MQKTRQPVLATLRAAPPLQPVGDGAAQALPDRFLILPWGAHETKRYGRITVNERTAAVLSANQTAIKRPTLKGDFQHESCLAAGVAKHPLTFAVESGRPVVVPGEGIYIQDAKWTEAGRRHVPTDYGDISAAPYLDDDGVVIALHSFACCDHGEIDGVTIAPATLSADLALLSASSSATGAAGPGSPQPPAPTSAKPMDTATVTALLAKHGHTVPADATPEQLSALLDTVLTKPAADPAAAADPAVSGEPATLSAQLSKLQSDFNSFRTDTQSAAAKLDIQRLIDAAAGVGKLVQLSADDLHKLGTDSAKSYLDKLQPNVVPLSQRTPAALSAGQSTTGTMHADTAAALRDLGHDPATFKG